jgi:hypothetical protein
MTGIKLFSQEPFLLIPIKESRPNAPSFDHSDKA